jgi:hypothetical protein
MTALDLKKHGYRERVLNDPAGRSRWDLAILFDRRQVEVKRKRTITAPHDNRTLRAGYGIQIAVPDQKLVFELFLAHWPSRRMGGEDESRQCCARALWNAIEKLLRGKERVVVLGDFNDEPHDVAVSKTLRASRDPETVVLYPAHRLYNPSWWLASPTLGGAWADFGTMHYQKSGGGTRWHTPDQALTCHQWLDREGRWAPEIRALRPSITATSHQRIFDHVAIELTLTR